MLILTASTTGTMAAIITDVGSVVTAAIGWIGDYVTEITSNPLLMIFICLPLVGLGIGLIKRMIQL